MTIDFDVASRKVVDRNVMDGAGINSRNAHELNEWLERLNPYNRMVAAELIPSNDGQELGGSTTGYRGGEVDLD